MSTRATKKESGHCCPWTLAILEKSPMHRQPFGSKYLLILAVVACAHADVSHLFGKHSSHAVPKYSPPAPPKHSSQAYSKTDDGSGIVRNDYQLSPEGSFQYTYETANGIAAQAEGVVKNANSENAELEVKGAVKYVSPEGVNVAYSYVANGDGYQPQGDLLPVAPAPPVWLARALEYIRTHPYKEDVVEVNSAKKYYRN
ncbi:Larval cuticle protein LCP-17 [Eumeta japonica]|uniref:Larval cuticle protein LCP-17 n=1 Tax=Eumeta variegata TaxID=151549 RepID=A0A4C1UX52_EUMVA|nr:Larval cuticle protein LCP-17 [Eumeta japonica]